MKKKDKKHLYSIPSFIIEKHNQTEALTRRLYNNHIIDPTSHRPYSTRLN